MNSRHKTAAIARLPVRESGTNYCFYRQSRKRLAVFALSFGIEMIFHFFPTKGNAISMKNSIKNGSV